jgi:hypothetical protein
MGSSERTVAPVSMHNPSRSNGLEDLPDNPADVCRHLRIPLRHHDAGSDAEACARIVIAALEAEVYLPSRSSLPERKHI